jgi:hypothetical protein
MRQLQDSDSERTPAGINPANVLPLRCLDVDGFEASSIEFAAGRASAIAATELLEWNNLGTTGRIGWVSLRC